MLTSISPLDGRYADKIAALSPYFSEYALIRYRVWVEIEYLIALENVNLAQYQPLNEAQKSWLRGLYEAFSVEEGEAVKAIERVTNHDVKAVEYWIREQIQAKGDAALVHNIEFVHFGLTSQDVNNTAVPLSLRHALESVYLPSLTSLISQLESMAKAWKSVAMLAYTHGQPASPTAMGKEIAVFVQRLKNQAEELATLPYPAKFGGATGNLNAHYIAYPQTDWQGFAEKFVADLGLSRSFPTTQIEHYDGLARIFHCIQRINSILIDLSQDMWLYISKEYFRQQTKAGEVGSSAMPHKVNPIDFENAEGNCGLSTAILAFLSQKLPISRLQRDLTDSTLLRNLGVGIGHSYLSILSIQKGLGKLLLNQNKIQADLDQNWAVLAEPIQTILRREGVENPYDLLKALTRGNHGINAENLRTFIADLTVSEDVKKELSALRPENYIGNSESFL